MPRLLRAALAGLLLTLAGNAATAEEDHPFRRYCQGCHESGGALARDSVVIVDGAPRTRRSGEPLAAFLAHHFGHPDARAIARLAEVLYAHALDGGRFKEKCGLCHRRASTLARSHLLWTGGRLVGRYSGRDITVFLAGHGRLSTAEAARFTEVLAALARGHGAVAGP